MTSYCSRPAREMLFIQPKWPSDLRRSQRVAYDSVGGLRDDETIARISRWAAQNLSESERAALAKALGGGAADFMLTSATASRETKALAGPKAASSARDGEPIMSRAEQRDAIIRWLQVRGISDEDVMKVAAMLGDRVAASDLPENRAGAQDALRRRYFGELRRDGLSEHDARIAADSLARVNAGKPAPAPAPTKAAQEAGRRARFPGADRVHVNNHGAPIPRKATFDSKAQAGFASRFPAAMKVRLGG